MIKLKTILPKDPADLGRVIPGNLIPGIKFFSLKVDGTACMIKDGIPYCRYDLKSGKSIPNGAIPCQEADLLSGHHPHWIPLDINNHSHKYMLEGFKNLKFIQDGTYECIGPKIQGNPHQEDTHLFIPHFYEDLNFEVNFDLMNENPYNYFYNLFLDFPYEGLIAYDSDFNPIGKIRRKDFGFKNTKFNKISSLFNTSVPSYRFHKIIEDFLNIADDYYNYETVTAPSGEWNEYNYEYLILEREYETYKNIISNLGILFEEFFDENNKFDYISFTYKKENL